MGGQLLSYYSRFFNFSMLVVVGFIILMGLAVLIFWGCGLVLSVYEVVVGMFCTKHIHVLSELSSLYCYIYAPFSQMGRREDNS